MSYLLNIVGAVALTGVTILGINWLFNDWNKFLEGIGKFSLIAGLLLGISAVGGVLATMDGEDDDIGKSIKYMLGVTGAVTLAALAIFGMNWLFEDWDKFLEGVGKFAIVSGVLLTIAGLAGVMVSMDEGGNITKGLLVMGGVVLLMGGLTLVMNKFISMSQSMEENSESVEYALMWSGIFVGGLSALVVGIGALASNPATAFGLLMGVSILAGVEALIFGLSLVMGKFADMSQRMYENKEALEYSMKWSGIFVGGMSALVAAIGLMATNPLVATGLAVGVGVLGGVELLMYGLTTVMNKTVDLAVQTANHRDEIMEALDFLPIMSRSIIKTVKEVAELTFEGKGFFDKLKSGAKTTIGSMQSIVVFDTGVTLLRSQKRFFDLLIQTANLYRQELSRGDIDTTIKTINDTTKFYIDNTLQTLDGVDMKAIRVAREKVKAIHGVLIGSLFRPGLFTIVSKLLKVMTKLGNAKVIDGFGPDGKPIYASLFGGTGTDNETRFQQMALGVAKSITTFVNTLTDELQYLNGSDFKKKTRDITSSLLGDWRHKGFLTLISQFVKIIKDFGSLDIPLYENGEEIGRQPFTTDIAVGLATTLSKSIITFIDVVSDGLGNIYKNNPRIKRQMDEMTKALIGSKKSYLFGIYSSETPGFMEAVGGIIDVILNMATGKIVKMTENGPVVLDLDLSPQNMTSVATSLANSIVTFIDVFSSSVSTNTLRSLRRLQRGQLNTNQIVSVISTISEVYKTMFEDMHKYSQQSMDNLPNLVNGMFTGAYTYILWANKFIGYTTKNIPFDGKQFTAYIQSSHIVEKYINPLIKSSLETAYKYGGADATSKLNAFQTITQKVVDIQRDFYVRMSELDFREVPQGSIDLVNIVEKFDDTLLKNEDRRT